MNIYTGCYDKCKTGNLISISFDKGKDAGFNGKTMTELAPFREFFHIWKDNIGKIPEKENTRYYIEQYYNKVLSKVNIMNLLEKEENPILLCYEASEEFCHRHVLAEYINIKYGILVQEIEINEELEITIKERPKNIRPILEQVIRNEYLKYGEK